MEDGDKPGVDYAEQAREFASSHGKDDPQMILDQLLIWAREIAIADNLRHGTPIDVESIAGHFDSLVRAVRGEDKE